MFVVVNAQWVNIKAAFCKTDVSLSVHGDRPTSQMSFLEQFLKETSVRGSSSIGSDDGDVEDNQTLQSRGSYISQVRQRRIPAITRDAQKSNCLLLITNY